MIVMVKDKDLRPVVQKKLRKFIQEFDISNRGNRLSKELIAGLAGFLEEFIVKIYYEIASEVKDDGNIPPLHEKPVTTDLLSTELKNRN